MSTELQRQTELMAAIVRFTERITENQNKLTTDPGYFQSFVIAQVNFQIDLVKEILQIDRNYNESPRS